MATCDVLVNEPSQMRTIGSMFPGFVDRLVPRKLCTDFPAQNRANETWVTRNQLIELPRNTDNEMA
jgi:hypothetical protein